MVLGLTSVDEAVNSEIHQVTNYEYNALNQLASETNPDNVTTTYSYDLLGQNLSKGNTDVLTSYTYDGLGRVENIKAQGNSKDENISFTYDLLGNVKEMSDSSGVTYYIYDSIGNLIKEKKNYDVKEYTYDANGNRKSFKLNNDIYLSYTYDILNRLISVSDGSDTTSYTYDNNGNLLNSSGKVSTDYEYNKAGFLTSKINKSGENILNQYSLDYYLNGNIERIADSDKTTSYTYDNMGRLIKEAVSGEGETYYSYDNFSNRTEKILKNNEGSLISTNTYSYDKNNRLWQIKEDNKITLMYYDISGNMTFKGENVLSTAADEQSVTISTQNPEFATAYKYDALNRLINVNGDNLNATYTYDGNGLRQSKTVNGITTNHIYDGQNIVKDGEQTFVRGLSLISRKVNGNKEYYAFNSHNDITALVNASGTVLKDYTYDAFGNEKELSDTDTNPFRFCGEYFDSETGLIYLRVRYYDPSIGRFISEDSHWNPNNMIYGDKEYRDGKTKIPDMSAMLQSSNLYAYCMNNPVKYVDPSGEEGVAATMLYHAFFGNGEFQDYSYNTMFLTTFNSSVVLQNKIDEKLAEFKKSGLSTNTITGDDLALYGKSNLNDYDLSFAVGKANYTMTFNKVEKNKSFLFWNWKETNYNVTVTITDIYNFDEYRDSKSIGAILNNWGYDKQKAGQIKPFEWKITFTVKGLE